MCNRSMSLSGLRVPFAMPIALTFAPCSSPLPSKRIKLDPYQTGKHSPALEKEETALGRREEQDKQKRYCCGYHTERFEQDFESGDEEMPKQMDGKYGKMTFLQEIPIDVMHYLAVKRNLRDSGTQPEEDGPSLAVLANYTALTNDGSVCLPIPAQAYAGPYHLPEYVQPKLAAFRGLFSDVPVGPNCPVECPICRQRFTTGQALGGHTSRKHSTKPHNRLRRLPDESES